MERRQSEARQPSPAGRRGARYPEGRGEGGGGGRRTGPDEPSLRPRPPRRGTHPRSGSRCSPWREASGAGPSPTRGGRGGSTGSRAAAPASLQHRGCLRSAPLPPPLSIPPRGSRRRRCCRRRLAPPPRLCSRPGRGWPGDWLRPAPPPSPGSAAALPAHFAALPREPSAGLASLPPPACPQPHVGPLAGRGWARARGPVEPRRVPTVGLRSRVKKPGPTLRFWWIDFQGLLREKVGWV